MLNSWFIKFSQILGAIEQFLGELKKFSWYSEILWMRFRYFLDAFQKFLSTLQIFDAV